VPLHDVGRELVDAAVGDDPASLEDRELLGDVANEIEVLLDQQHGTIAFGHNALDDGIDLLDDGGLQPLGAGVDTRVGVRSWDGLPGRRMRKLGNEQMLATFEKGA
jgi:hypothetical protein